MQDTNSTLAWLEGDLVSPEELASNKRHLAIGVRWAVASNSRTPVSALVVMAKDPDDSVRKIVAQHPSTPVTVLLEMLLRDVSMVVAGKAAENPNLPGETIDGVWRDLGQYKRRMLARNVSIWASTLVAMYEVDPETRVSMAGNPSLPVELMREMIKDPESMEVVILARRDDVPEDVVEQVPVEVIPLGVIKRRLKDHPSLDMILSLAQNWEGTIKDLVVAVEKLDMRV